MDSNETDSLYQRLGEEARAAFNKLCSLGCECSELERLFGWLSSFKIIRIATTAQPLMPVRAVQVRKGMLRTKRSARAMAFHSAIARDDL